MIAWGSPPRVRSRLNSVEGAETTPGITSACAEQTFLSIGIRRVTGDHLRVCGADLFQRLVSVLYEGSPPRVRSRLTLYAADNQQIGITSACAEQTSRGRGSDRSDRDHLRVCGADLSKSAATVAEEGSPPRVRSRLRGRGRVHGRCGITSACAEQTTCGRGRWWRRRDHLRVCGADARGLLPDTVDEGSPPRVRSRQDGQDHPRVERGITSACAEQTVFIIEDDGLHRDHLRVCGADFRCCLDLLFAWGSPPRVRSRRIDCGDGTQAMRITSACAEQTTACTPSVRWSRDHLRVCGADIHAQAVYKGDEGSPPRVRSRRGWCDSICQ